VAAPTCPHLNDNTLNRPESPVYNCRWASQQYRSEPICPHTGSELHTRRFTVYPLPPLTTYINHCPPTAESRAGGLRDHLRMEAEADGGEDRGASTGLGWPIFDYTESPQVRLVEHACRMSSRLSPASVETGATIRDIQGTLH
jgi:hypothetical protein